MHDEKTRRLRRADFWTALVLLGVAGLLLRGALGFPITDSYGGVENVWYVSPALFPLLVTAALACLALLLLVNAVQTGGAADALAQVRKPISRLDAGQRKLLLMATLLVGYVYGFIPYVDYIAGSVFFLLAFIAAFHVGDVRGVRVTVAIFLTLSLATALVGAAGLAPRPSTVAALWFDGLVLVALSVALAALFLRVPTERGRLVVVATTAIAVPLLLAPAFKYGLLVPLPREGLIVGAMDAVRYALRAALG